MGQIKFSIVISVYSKIPDLRRCLLALRVQLEKRADSEVVIVNDGGQPDVEEAVKQALSGMKAHYFFVEHGGPAKARNLGIRNSKGEIIIFLDADAVPQENWLDAFTQAWERAGQTEGIGGYIAIDPKDSIICRVSSCYCNWFLEQSCNEEEAAFLLMGNASYKREALLNIDGFDENFREAAGEDRDLNLRLLQNGCKLKIDKNIKVYHDKTVTLFNFIQRHFLQGRMAYKLRDKYPSLKKMPLRAYLSFYKNLRQGCRGLFEISLGCILFMAAQALTACGYLQAAFIGFFSRKGSQMPITPRLDINLGYICNNNCLFCYFLGRKKECVNIDGKKARDIMLQAKRSGIKVFEVTGGEPALRKDIVELVSFASGKLGIKDITVITNGSRFSDENFVSEMKNAGMNDVLISIHGANAEIHDTLTQNKGSFENAIRAIKNIVSQGISCRSNTVITSVNYKQVPEIAGLMHNLGVKQLNFILFAPLDDARAMQKQLWVKYSDAISYLRVAIDRYKDDFKNISVKALP
ncbi:MAG: radical SAM protein, partial [Candidatus Omnitrophica bacterium]|nr:radical SAM protein [Candidatus Omnitrophota bacterium]